MSANDVKAEMESARSEVLEAEKKLTAIKMALRMVKPTPAQTSDDGEQVADTNSLKISAVKVG